MLSVQDKATAVMPRTPGGASASRIVQLCIVKVSKYYVHVAAAIQLCSIARQSQVFVLENQILVTDNTTAAKTQFWGFAVVAACGTTSL